MGGLAAILALDDTPSPASPIVNQNFDSRLSLRQDVLHSSECYIQGNHYDSYMYHRLNADRYTCVSVPASQRATTYVSSKDIEGVHISKADAEVRPDGTTAFWDGTEGTVRYGKDSYVNRARQIPYVQHWLNQGMTLDQIAEQYPHLQGTVDSYFRAPISVNRCGDHFEFNGSGRHRVAAAMLAGVDIPVQVVGEFEYHGAPGRTNIEQLELVDNTDSPASAIIRDVNGNLFTIKPDPTLSATCFGGKQGQNSYGLTRDCGLASTANGLTILSYPDNPVYEDDVVDYALSNRLCGKDGGTMEEQVCNIYRHFGAVAGFATDENTVPLDRIAEYVEAGGIATIAVSSTLLWGSEYDGDSRFNPIDTDRYLHDKEYHRCATQLRAYRNGRSKLRPYVCDHFVNVTNVIYGEDDSPSAFMVCDTGTGRVALIPADVLRTSYEGDDNHALYARGCVIAYKGSNMGGQI